MESIAVDQERPLLVAAVDTLAAVDSHVALVVPSSMMLESDPMARI